ncbi:MAG TPA: Na/Pi symporter [Ancylobacter sp.]
MIAELMSGLGLFFIGVRGLSSNLVPLVGRRTRAAFARALNGNIGCAVSGMIAGMVTQSSSAVSWIIVSFVRAGVLPDGPALLAPTWANVGTALLPLIVAIDTSIAAGAVIGIVGFATYFKLVRDDQWRNALEAALGAALLLFGMHLVSVAVGPIRDGLMHNEWWETALNSPWILAIIGMGFSCAAQSSSVAAAIAVAAVGGGLLDLTAALPLIAGANAAAMINNALLIPGETTAGRAVFALQVVQKAGGSLLLVAIALIAELHPGQMTGLMRVIGDDTGTQIAILFLIAQIGGALIGSLLEAPTRRAMLWLMPADAAETLAEPAFLLREAVADPSAALDLSMREMGRLSARLPLLLDMVRDEPEPGTPSALILRNAGVSLAGTVKAYLTSVLDNKPTRRQVSTALLLEDAADNAGALHEALAEFTEAAALATSLPTASRLIEALHALMFAVADHAESLGTEAPDIVLSLLGHRDQLMEELRVRLSSQSDVPADVQNALFRMTVLFERIVWLARRLVNDISQAQRGLAGD